jgi:hypothetical protein
VTNELKAQGQLCATNSVQTYCFDKSYYANINVAPIATTTSGSLTCYEFNGTSSSQAEVTIGQNQLDQITT